MSDTEHPKGPNYLLQKLDCNCNDCKYMIRDFERYRVRLEEHNRDLLERFESRKRHLLQAGSTEALAELRKMKFQPDSKVNEGFGHCSKFDKPVDFIPGICLIHTQKCFVHRKDQENE
jgi:hypothetical protein